MQNAARAQRGVADPNLSLLAWRSAMILNRLAGRQVYECEPASSIIDWNQQLGDTSYDDDNEPHIAL